jgi:hypothetical protein
MEKFSLTKQKCYELASRFESLGLVEWVAKECENEFLRIQPTIMQATGEPAAPQKNTAESRII